MFQIQKLNFVQIVNTIHIKSKLKTDTDNFMTFPNVLNCVELNESDKIHCTANKRQEQL